MHVAASVTAAFLSSTFSVRSAHSFCATFSPFALCCIAFRRFRVTSVHDSRQVPADLLMTRYQAASQMGRTYSGLMQCALGMMKEEGPAVFLRGWLPMFSRVAPLYIVYLPAYEQTRMLLGMTYLD